MNFKTPFKVLTTAALIGTLSLSTVAPGAAFAEETNQTTTTTDQVAQENKLDAVIIEKDGKLYSLSPADYLKLKGSNDALLEGSKLKYLVSQGKSYNPQEFLTAKASNEQSVDKAFKSLDENDQEVADVTASPVTVDTEGNAVIGEEAAPVDKTALEAAIADAEKLEIADETAKAALAEAVKAAKEEAAKEEATQADIDKAVEALSKAVEAAKASIPVIVESVTAITQTIDLTGGELSFKVNDKEYTVSSFKEEFGKDYTVKFTATKAKLVGAANADATSNTTGKVKAGVAADTFEYAVEIFDKDGESVAASEARAKVSYTDLAQQIKTVKASLENANGVVASGKVAKDDTLTVKATGTTSAKAEEAVLTNAVNGITFESNRTAVATVNNNGGVTLTGVEGEVTITVKSKDGKVTDSVTFEVTDQATRTVSAENSVVTEDSLELSAGKKGKVTVELKDKFGDAFVPATPADLVVTNKDDATVVALSAIPEAVKDAEGDEIPGKYTVEVTAGAETATGKATVKFGTTVLKDITVKVTKAGAVVDAKDKVVAGATSLDLYKTATTDLTINKYDANDVLATEVALTTNNAEAFTTADATYSKTYVVKSSNKDVAVFESGEVTGKKVGTATVTVYKVNGAFLDEVGTVDVTVEDSKPSLKAVEFKSVDAVKTEQTIALTDVIKSLDVQDAKGTAAEYKYVVNGPKVEIKDAKNTKIGEVTIDGKGVATIQENATTQKPEIKFAKADDAVKGNVTVSVIAGTKFLDGKDIAVDLPATELAATIKSYVAKAAIYNNDEGFYANTEKFVVPSAPTVGDKITFLAAAGSTATEYIYKTDSVSGFYANTEKFVEPTTSAVGDKITFLAAAAGSTATEYIYKAATIKDEAATNFTITFNKAVSSATKNATIKVGSTTASNVAWTNSDKTVTFKIAGQLAGNQTVTIGTDLTITDVTLAAN